MTILKVLPTIAVTVFSIAVFVSTYYPKPDSSIAFAAQDGVPGRRVGGGSR
jgi:hypothetical protein